MYAEIIFKTIINGKHKGDKRSKVSKQFKIQITEELVNLCIFIVYQFYLNLKKKSLAKNKQN